MRFSAVSLEGWVEVVLEGGHESRLLVSSLETLVVVILGFLIPVHLASPALRVAVLASAVPGGLPLVKGNPSVGWCVPAVATGRTVSTELLHAVYKFYFTR